tara:strand:- start:388 stop:861 length:474 start_codon:yes stop_codon:yes gene_type:complete
MENVKQKEMRNGLIFGTILLIPLLIFFWINPLKGEESLSLIEQVGWTVLIAIGLVGGWGFYLHQKKLDKFPNPNGKDNLQEKAFRTTNKFHGGLFKIGSIKWAAIGILFLIGGIAIIISSPEYWWAGVLLILLAIALIVVVKIFWNLGKTKLDGRYY